MRLGRVDHESVVDARDPRSTARSVLRGLTLRPRFDCPIQGDDVVVECDVYASRVDVSIVVEGTHDAALNVSLAGLWPHRDVVEHASDAANMLNDLPSLAVTPLPPPNARETVSADARNRFGRRPSQ